MPSVRRGKFIYMNLSVFTELFALGMNPIPVIWDLQTKQVTDYPKHETDITDGRPRLQDVERWLNNGFKNFNGIALKLYPPFGMFDFDLKNTSNKQVFANWLEGVKAVNEDVLKKVCIETTRNGGYHVYIKYPGLDAKNTVARAKDGEEIISVYTGGLLSFCYPSPNYALIHNGFEDIEELTKEEYELLVAISATFHENEEIKSGESKVVLTSYPPEYENLCLQFDYKCTDEVFELLLNSIDLYRLNDTDINRRFFRSKAYVPFLRKGSSAMYSAKAYFSHKIEHEGKIVAETKRLLIFSGSMVKFPTWHDCSKSGDTAWSLSPSKIVFYKNGKNWANTIEEIQMIADSAGIDIIPHTPVTQQPLIPFDRLKFPYDIFPAPIRNFISFQSIQHEYLAGAILAALSTSIGNSVALEAKDGYMVKPVLYLAIIAPPGASKTPALKTAFKPIEDFDDELYTVYQKQLDEYKVASAKYEKDKQNIDKPEKPNFPQTLIKDSTIEMVIKILSHNKLGCAVLADELSGFLKRMNQYKSGDEVQKWLELWSGSPVLLQRISREENKVQDPFCTVVGGIQPGVLESLSKEENEHNGFFHRFLFVYPLPQDKTGWITEAPPLIVKQDFSTFFREILSMRKPEKYIYRLSTEANTMYADWYEYKNGKYNKSNSEHVKGIIAKYQDYCLRFALLVQCIEDGTYRKTHVSEINMEKAIRLTEYFLGNMQKAVKLLAPETPADRLQKPHSDFYADLPENFSLKTAYIIGEKYNMSKGSIKMFISRDSYKIFNNTGVGEYQKLF